MLFLKIALRNIGAHRRKNLVVFSVTAGVCLFMFLFLSFSDGEIQNIKNGISSFYSPALDIRAVSPENWRMRQEGGNHAEATIPAASSYTAALRELPFVEEAVAAVWSVGADMFTGGKKYLGLYLIAQDSGDRTMRGKYSITEGRDLEQSGDGHVLLHYKTARNLPLKIGDALTLVGTDLFGQITTREMTIGGFYRPFLDNPNMASNLILLRNDQSWFVGYGEDEVNSLMIRLARGANAKKSLTALQAWAEEKAVPLVFFLVSDEENDSGFIMIYGMIRLLIVAMVLITLFITSFGIMNVISINLYERKKEIGTYFCLGTEPPFLMAAYTAEIFLVNLGGALTGIALGFLSRAIINALRITSEDPGFQIVVGSSTFYLGYSASTIFWLLGGVAVITIITALTTLGKALKVSPVVAVRETE